MGGLFAVGIVVAVLLLVLFVAWAVNSRWAGERGWIYNKHNPGRRGSGTLGLLESVYQPSIEYVIEERSSERARGNQDESGGKPQAGGTGAIPG